jgi:hypothetical protein
MKCQNTPDLPHAVDAYLYWMNSAKYSRNTFYHYQRIVQHFGAFANASNIASSDLFTCKALKAFETKPVRVPVRGLSRYLYENNQLEVPMKTLPETLPDIYEEYLVYYKDTRNVSPGMIRSCRNVFIGLHRRLIDLVKQTVRGI